MRKHSSFLLRCWELGNEGQRIEIEHIQAGTKMLARSVADAVEWICAQGGTGAHHEPATSARGEGATDSERQ